MADYIVVLEQKITLPLRKKQEVITKEFTVRSVRDRRYAIRSVRTAGNKGKILEVRLIPKHKHTVFKW